MWKAPSGVLLMHRWVPHNTATLLELRTPWDTPDVIKPNTRPLGKVHDN